MKLPNLPTLREDLANHLAYGVALAALGATAHSALAGALLCAGFSIGWELLQRVLKVGHPSVEDAVAGLAGGALVLAPLVLGPLVRGGA